MLKPGEVIAGYRIERVLGRGGMGVVYEATQLALKRTVALKVIAPQLGDDPVFQSRMRREGRLQGRLDHPNVVPIYEAGESDDGMYLAMRLVRGPTLKEMITTGQVDPPRALRILGQIAGAIDDAHRIGLVHRDIKPQNILVDAGDHPFLSDFGLTHATGETSLTASGAFVGTYDYVSPEQVDGERATPLSDIYSFAGVLYEALTGVVPYPKRSRAAVLYAHVATPPPKVSEQSPELPAALDGVIAVGMAKDPATRCSTARELIARAESVVMPVAATAEYRYPVEAEIVPHDTPATPERQRTTSPMPTDEVRLAPAWRRAVRSVPRPATTAAAAAAAIAISTGLVLGSAGGTKPQRLTVVSSGVLSLRYPPPLRRTSRPRAPATLALRDAIALDAGAGNSVVAGLDDVTGPSLLPAAVRSTGGRAPRAQPVALGPLEALAYRSLDPSRTGGIRRLYAVPVTGGSADVACVSHGPPSRTFLADCDRVAAAMRLHGMRTFPAGPDPLFAAAVRNALAGVTTARTREAPALAAARPPSSDAAAARHLSAAYANAAHQLDRAAVPPQAVPLTLRLQASLTQAARAYAALAAAADKRDPGAYARAVAAARRAEANVTHRVGDLRPLGYAVQ